jgi:hypothetical protein
MKVPALYGTALLVACTVLHAGQAPTPDLRDVVNAYIDRFVETYGNIVAEEQIRQEADGPRAKRTIRSDFVVIRFPGPQLYVFRDAFEVDGQRVRDPEDERLPKLFDEPTTAALTHAQALSNATTRHYVREIGTVNNPLLVISLLQRTNRHRFLLSVAGKEGSLGPTIRRIGFTEVATPTVLRWGGNIDMPAEGRLWVDEPTGRIVKTELKLGERDIRSQSTVAWRPPTVVTVTFGTDEALGIDVALEMRDKYPMDRGEVRGVTTYSRFRRLGRR